MVHHEVVAYHRVVNRAKTADFDFAETMTRYIKISSTIYYYNILIFTNEGGSMIITCCLTSGGKT